MSYSAIEYRLRSLEHQLGLYNYCETEGNRDVATRMEALERQMAALSSSSAVAEVQKEIESIMEDLSPGTALTHQKQIMAPILYRRQEVLASSATFQADMENVAQILNLLDIQQQRQSNNRSSQQITEQQVVQAPILMMVDSSVGTITTAMTAAEQTDKLDALSNTLVDLMTRVQQAGSKFDRMLHNYHALVAAVSEKLVLADEEMQLREQKACNSR